MVLTTISKNITCEQLENQIVGAKIAEDQKNFETGIVPKDKLSFFEFDAKAADAGEYRLQPGEKQKTVSGFLTEKGDAIQNAMKNVRSNIDDIQYLYEQYQQVELKRQPNTPDYENFDGTIQSCKLLKEHWAKMFVFITTDKFKSKSDNNKVYSISTIKSYPQSIISIIRYIDDEDINDLYKEISPYNTKVCSSLRVL